VVELYDMDDLLIKFVCYPRISGSKGPIALYSPPVYFVFEITSPRSSVK
jgi:hypothetical protein